MNRRMRNGTYGGVRGRDREAPAYSMELRIKISYFTDAKHLMDIGMENGFLPSDEINDLLPRNIFSPEDIEDAFDFFSECDIDIVETIQDNIRVEGHGISSL